MLGICSLEQVRLRLTFDKYATSVAKSCNYHAQAIRHIRHLLTLELAQTLACSLILSRIDYCNALLHADCTGCRSSRESLTSGGGHLQSPVHRNTSLSHRDLQTRDRTRNLRRPSLLCWLSLPQELTLPDGLSVIQHCSLELTP